MCRSWPAMFLNLLGLRCSTQDSVVLGPQLDLRCLAAYTWPRAMRFDVRVSYGLSNLLHYTPLLCLSHLRLSAWSAVSPWCFSACGPAVISASFCSSRPAARFALSGSIREQRQLLFSAGSGVALGPGHSGSSCVGGTAVLRCKISCTNRVATEFVCLANVAS